MIFRNGEKYIYTGPCFSLLEIAICSAGNASASENRLLKIGHAIHHLSLGIHLYKYTRFQFLKNKKNRKKIKKKKYPNLPATTTSLSTIVVQFFGTNTHTCINQDSNPPTSSLTRTLFPPHCTITCNSDGYAIILY